MKDPAYLMELKELYAELKESGKDEVDNKIEQIKSAFTSLALFIAVAIVAPIISFYVIIPKESPETWFKRAGSVTVVFGLLAEIAIAKLKLLSFTDSSPFLYGHIYLKRKYSNMVRWADRGTLLVVIFGTVIWGYGDILYRAFN